MREFDEETTLKNVLLKLGVQFTIQNQDSAVRKCTLRLEGVHGEDDDFDWDLIDPEITQFLSSDAKDPLNVPNYYYGKVYTSYKELLKEWCRRQMYPLLYVPLYGLQLQILKQYVAKSKPAADDGDDLDDTDTFVYKRTDENHLGWTDLRLFHIYEMEGDSEYLRDMVGNMLVEAGVYGFEEDEESNEPYEIQYENSLDDDLMTEVMYVNQVYYDYLRVGRHIALFMLMQNMIKFGLYTKKSEEPLPTRREFVAILEKETCGRKVDFEYSFEYENHWLYKEMYENFATVERMETYKNYYSLMEEEYHLYEKESSRWEPWNENWLSYDYPTIK